MEAERRAAAAALARGHEEEQGRPPPSSASFLPRGVLSTSETCYFGAVIQALAASPSVVAYFRALAHAIGGKDGADADSDDADDAPAPLARAVARLVEQLSAAAPAPPPPDAAAAAPVDPSAAIEALSKYHRDFAAAFEGEHQDAAEALEALLNASAAEARAWLRRDVVALAPGLAAVLDSDPEGDRESGGEEEEEEEEDAAAAAATTTLVAPTPPRRAPRSPAEAAEAAAAAAAPAAPAAAATTALDDDSSDLLELWRALASPPLEGQLLHLRACLSCANRAERALSPFFVLPLPVPAAAAASVEREAVAAVRPGASLDQCLRLFTAQELLSGVRCARCDLRRALAGAERAAALVLPPPTPGQAAARRELAALAAGGPQAGPLADDDVLDLRALARRAGLPLGLGGGGRGGGAGVVAAAAAAAASGSSSSSSSALRQSVICRAPAVLALQLLRARPGQRKLHGRIAYPALLDISAFVLAGEERAGAAAAAAASGDALAAAAAPSLLYELVAVVQHLGAGTGRGHYLTYRRVSGGSGGGGRGGGGWARADDARVDACGEGEALGCQGAALLLYERVELFAPSSTVGGGGGGMGGRLVGGIPLVGGGG